MAFLPGPIMAPAEARLAAQGPSQGCGISPISFVINTLTAATCCVTVTATVIAVVGLLAAQPVAEPAWLRSTSQSAKAVQWRSSHPMTPILWHSGQPPDR